jgi:hypothetical protein
LIRAFGLLSYAKLQHKLSLEQSVNGLLWAMTRNKVKSHTFLIDFKHSPHLLAFVPDGVG